MVNSKKKNLLDVGYLFITQGLNYIIPLIIFPYLLRVLGPNRFGEIGLAQATSQYFILIVDFGFNLSATRRIAIYKNNNNELKKIFSATMYSKIILCVFCFCLQMALTNTVDVFINNKTVINVFFLSVLGSVLFPVWYFQGIEKMKIITIINILTRISLLPLIILFVKKGDDYLIAAYLQSIIYLLSGIFSIMYLLAKTNIRLVKFDISNIFTEVKESWLVFLSSAAINIYTTSFVLILGLYATTTAIGYYTAAEKIIRVSTYLFFAPISQSFYPKISALAIKDVAKAKELIKKILLVTFVVFLIQGLTILFFGNFFLILLGKEYVKSLYLIKIMSFVPMLIALGGILGQLGFLAFGQTKKYAQVYLTSGLLSIFFVVVLTAKFKEVGTAYALFITEGIVFILMYYYAGKTFLSKKTN